MEDNKKSESTLGWSVFIGSMFVGLGVGAFFDQEGAGMLIGMGVGYIASEIAERMTAPKARQLQLPPASKSEQI